MSKYAPGVKAKDNENPADESRATDFAGVELEVLGLRK
jgi:hypothetical protein